VRAGGPPEADGAEPDGWRTPGSEGNPLVVGFGEALIRLTAQHRMPLEYATELAVSVGGAELNFLITLAKLGCRSRWVSSLPENPFGRLIARHAWQHRVATEIDWDADGRAGLYFVEEGVYPRPTRVHYDRAGSVASQLTPGVFDWPTILADASALHSTGITCALGPDTEKALLEAFQCASGAGVLTTFDLNYRGQLWPPEAAAAAARRVLPLVDIFFVSPFDLQLVGGSGTRAEVARRLRQEFGLSAVIVRTQQEISTGVLEVSVQAFGEDPTEATGSARAAVLDAFGAGDAAAAAFIAGWLRGEPLQQAVSAAAAASAFMYTIPGDTWLRPPAEFNAENGRLGRIHR
jgi:2-dehydro-3-deoxygluconokinase